MSSLQPFGLRRNEWVRQRVQNGRWWLKDRGTGSCKTMCQAQLLQHGIKDCRVVQERRGQDMCACMLLLPPPPPTTTTFTRLYRPTHHHPGTGFCRKVLQLFSLTFVHSAVLYFLSGHSLLAFRVPPVPQRFEEIGGFLCVPLVRPTFFSCSAVNAGTCSVFLVPHSPFTPHPPSSHHGVMPKPPPP